MTTGSDRDLIEAALQFYDLGPLQAFRHHAGTAAKTSPSPGRARPPAPPAKPKAADWFTEALNRNRSPKGS